MGMELPAKTVEHIKVCHEALEMANRELEKVARDREEAEKIIPEVIADLLAFERIDERSSKRAAELCRNPVEVLRMLKKAADPNIDVRPKPVGRSDVEKQASANPMGAKLMGQSPAFEESARFFMGD